MPRAKLTRDCGTCELGSNPNSHHVNLMNTDEIQELFREKHLKVTPQRCAIYGVLACTTSHPTADEILVKVKDTFPMISPNTIYYTLSTFEAAGLIVPINEAHTRYDANLAPHHHLICVSCRSIEDVYDDGLDQLQLSSKTDFKISGHRVQFYGRCGHCQEPARRAGSKTARRKT